MGDFRSRSWLGGCWPRSRLGGCGLRCWVGGCRSRFWLGGCGLRCWVGGCRTRFWLGDWGRRSTMTEAWEGLLRELVPQVLGVLVRRYGQFDSAEDAVQEALLAASIQWPREGVPENPRSWLISVAGRRLVDEFRSDSARRRREATTTSLNEINSEISDRDDTLDLLFLCAHPALSPPSQLALTLRAVGGLTTAEIASAFLVPESTMGQRISRAKQTIKAAGATFEMPPADERDERLKVVLHVLYLMLNEGYTSTSGPDLQRTDLSDEAVR